MKEKNENTGKGKIARLKALPLNTKLLIGLLAVAIFGVATVVAMPSIKEAREASQRREAAEHLFGKKYVEEVERLFQPPRRK